MSDPEHCPSIRNADGILPDEIASEDAAYNAGYEDGLKDNEMTRRWEERGKEIDTLGYERGEMLRVFRAISHYELRASRLPYRDRAQILKQVGDMAREVLRDFA